MNRHPALLLKVFFCLAMIPFFARALDNGDLIALHEAGLDVSVIATKMEQESADYDLSTDGLIELKQAGIPDQLIQKALLLQSGGSDDRRGSGAAAMEDIPSIAPPVITPESGNSYFLRSTLRYEKGRHDATNYSRGTLLPINTEVELTTIRGDQIRLRRKDTDERVTIVNSPKFTQVSTEELAQRMLAAEQTPLDRIPERYARAIEAGELRLGMTKELALMARGYPPGHETPSTESSHWKYWSSRFVTLTVVFDGDHLVEGRGIR